MSGSRAKIVPDEKELKRVSDAVLNYPEGGGWDRFPSLEIVKEYYPSFLPIAAFTKLEFSFGHIWYHFNLNGTAKYAGIADSDVKNELGDSKDSDSLHGWHAYFAETTDDYFNTDEMLAKLKGISTVKLNHLLFLKDKNGKTFLGRCLRSDARLFQFVVDHASPDMVWRAHYYNESNVCSILDVPAYKTLLEKSKPSKDSVAYYWLNAMAAYDPVKADKLIINFALYFPEEDLLNLLSLLSHQTMNSLKQKYSDYFGGLCKLYELDGTPKNPLQARHHFHLVAKEFPKTSAVFLLAARASFVAATLVPPQVTEYLKEGVDELNRAHQIYFQEISKFSVTQIILTLISLLTKFSASHEQKADVKAGDQKFVSPLNNNAEFLKHYITVLAQCYAREAAAVADPIIAWHSNLQNMKDIQSVWVALLVPQQYLIKSTASMKTILDTLLNSHRSAKESARNVILAFLSEMHEKINAIAQDQSAGVDSKIQFMLFRSILTCHVSHVTQSATLANMDAAVAAVEKFVAFMRDKKVALTSEDEKNIAAIYMARAKYYEGQRDAKSVERDYQKASEYHSAAASLQLAKKLEWHRTAEIIEHCKRVIESGVYPDVVEAKQRLDELPDQIKPMIAADKSAIEGILLPSIVNNIAINQKLFAKDSKTTPQELTTLSKKHNLLALYQLANYFKTFENNRYDKKRAATMALYFRVLAYTSVDPVQAVKTFVLSADEIKKMREEATTYILSKTMDHKYEYQQFARWAVTFPTLLVDCDAKQIYEDPAALDRFVIAHVSNASTSTTNTTNTTVTGETQVEGASSKETKFVKGKHLELDLPKIRTDYVRGMCDTQLQTDKKWDEKINCDKEAEQLSKKRDERQAAGRERAKTTIAAAAEAKSRPSVPLAPSAPPGSAAQSGLYPAVSKLDSAAAGTGPEGQPSPPPSAPAPGKDKK